MFILWINKFSVWFTKHLVNCKIFYSTFTTIFSLNVLTVLEILFLLTEIVLKFLNQHLEGFLN